MDPEQESLSAVERHLIAVNNHAIPLDENLIENIICHVSINKEVLQQHSAATKALLTAVVRILHNQELKIDYDQVIRVLDAIVSHLNFEELTSTFFSFEYLLEALRSRNVNLQIVALKVATRADPLDILANTELIPLAVSLLSKPLTPLKLVNEIENSMSVFLYSSLIRRRILSEHVLLDLELMANSTDTLVKMRLFDFIVKLLPFVQEHEVPTTLYTFNDFIQEDVMYILSLIKFYTDLVDISGGSLDKKWILLNTKDQMFQIGELYSQRQSLRDVEFFCISAISQFFKSLSFIAPDIFKEIDTQYVALAKNDELLLSSLSPAYLAKNHPDLIKNLSLTIDNVPIYRNMFKSEESFVLIRSSVNTGSLLRLPYLELVAVLVILTKYSYGARYLLRDLPQVVNKLLKGDHVIEKETYQLRKQTLENLNGLSDEQLGIWARGVRHEYSVLISGRSDVGVAEMLTL